MRVERAAEQRQRMVREIDRGHRPGEHLRDAIDDDVRGRQRRIGRDVNVLEDGEHERADVQRDAS